MTSSSPNSFNQSSSFDTSSNGFSSLPSPSPSPSTSTSTSNPPTATSATSSLLSPTYSTFQPNTSTSTVPSNPSSLHTTSSSSDQLLHLFQKRIQTFIYLKHSLSGKQSWFNTIRLSKRDLDLTFSPESMKKRTNRFLLLGINLGNLLDSNPTSTSMEGATEFCKTILNLIGELDLYMETGETPSNNGRKSNGTTSTIGKNFNFFGSVKGGSKAGKKGMGLGLGLGGSGFVGTGGVGEFGGTGTGGAESIERDSLNYSSGTSSQGVGMTNPGMGNFGGKDEGHLLIVNVPYHLDFFQTFFTLCDILSEIYHRLIFYLGSSPGLITLQPSSTSTNSSISGLTSSQAQTLSSLLSSSTNPNPTATATGASNSISSNSSTPGLYGNNGSSYFPSPPNSIGFSANGTLGSSGVAEDWPAPRSSFENQSSGVGTSIKGQSGSLNVKVEVMAKVDGKFKKIISQISKELDTLARNLIKEELSSLNPLLSELLPPIPNPVSVSNINPSQSTSTSNKNSTSNSNSNSNSSSNPTHSHTFSNSSSNTNQFNRTGTVSPFSETPPGMTAPNSSNTNSGISGLPTSSAGSAFPFTNNLNGDFPSNVGGFGRKTSDVSLGKSGKGELLEEMGI